MKLFKTIGFSVLLIGFAVAAILTSCDTGNSLPGSGDDTLSVSLSSTKEASVIISAVSTEDTTIYYVVAGTSASVPTGDEIIASSDAATASLYADVTRNITVSDLSDDTGYVFYAVGLNSESEQTSVVSVSFTTSAYSYPIDENTVAFWIFSRDDVSDGDTVSIDDTSIIVEDLTGNGNDLYLTTEEDCLDSLQQDDASFSYSPLQWVSDTSYDHAKNDYSLLFSGSKSIYGGYYLTVDNDAPLNSTDFDGTGYTIEAIVKIDDDFTSTDNRWMGIMSLSYPYDETNGYITQGDDPPFNMAVSNLKEIQYYSCAIDSWNNQGTNWSAEEKADEWIHIAIVETVSSSIDNRLMYIDGVKETRLSGDNTNGICARGDEYMMNFFVGAAQGYWSSSEHVADVFNGQIDAIRITKGALSTDDFLSVTD